MKIKKEKNEIVIINGNENEKNVEQYYEKNKNFKQEGKKPKQKRE